MVREREQGRREKKKLNTVNNVRGKKKREKQRRSTKNADTNLKSSRHSTCVKESRGGGELEEGGSQDEPGQYY